MQVPTKKTSKKDSKTDQNSNTRLSPKRAIRQFWSADWHKFGPRPKGTWIKLKHILSHFLEIRTRPSSYFDHLANFSNISASINKGWLSKFRTLFHTLGLPSFWLFSSFIFSLTLRSSGGSNLKIFIFVSKIF